MKTELGSGGGGGGGNRWGGDGGKWGVGVAGSGGMERYRLK